MGVPIVGLRIQKDLCHHYGVEPAPCQHDCVVTFPNDAPRMARLSSTQISQLLDVVPAKNVDGAKWFRNHIAAERTFQAIDTTPNALVADLKTKPYAKITRTALQRIVNFVLTLLTFGLFYLHQNHRLEGALLYEDLKTAASAIRWGATISFPSTKIYAYLAESQKRESLKFLLDQIGPRTVTRYGTINECLQEAVDPAWVPAFVGILFERDYFTQPGKDHPYPVLLEALPYAQFPRTYWNTTQDQQGVTKTDITLQPPAPQASPAVDERAVGS